MSPSSRASRRCRTRALGRVLVSGVHGASLRAVAYAQTLELDDVRAVFFAFDGEEARAIRRDWERYDVQLPLDVVEAPYRDLGDPLLHYLRALTADASRSSSCPNSSCTAGAGSSTTSVRSTSSDCSSSSRG